MIGSDHARVSDPGRFTVLYHITGTGTVPIDETACDIAIEQTVEAPDTAIPQSHLDEGIIGRVEEIMSLDPQKDIYRVAISYRTDITGFSVPQFFNTLFGNISLKNNIRIVDIVPSSVLSGIFNGPAHGIDGIRTLTGVWGRPLACTALKPMGLSVEKLAARAYAFARGGIDFIKDDHGIADQSFHPFEKRVAACQEAVERANGETGGRTLYFPSVCCPFDKIENRIRFAMACGVRGVLAAPMLVGLDTVRYLSATYKLIVMGHPALTGTFFSSSSHGIASDVFLGTLFRMLGVDISVFPNSGGRFPLTGNECRAIADALRKPSDSFKPAFPCPAGGMNIGSIPELIERYGVDFVILIGGALIGRAHDLSSATSAFMKEIRSSF